MKAMNDASMIRILVLIGLVIAVNIILFWRQNVDMSENRNDLEAQVSTLQRKRDNLLVKNADLERQIHRMELKLEHVETEVRDFSSVRHDRKNLPTIFFITPTKFRAEQKADLTRLGQTLAHIPNLFWIIVEDADEPSEMPTKLLDRLKLAQSSIHIVARTPPEKRRKDNDPNWKYPRGVVQRNAALDYIRTNHRSFKKSVIYFGDDDNVYDWRIFDEMRNIKKVGIFPVGIVGGMLVESPILSPSGTVVEFTSKWDPQRPFPIDMAAFAVNLTLIIEHPDAGFSMDVPRGYQESHFLQSLGLERSDLEPKADLCTKVYVWHTRTEKTQLLKHEKQKLFHTKDSEGLNQVEMDAIFL